MAIENRALVLDLIEWIGDAPRPYDEVMDAWRTSCPRLPVWEDAVDAGFVARIARNGSGPMVEVTDAGRAFLRVERAQTSVRR
jgi:D-3-phosphoglycerate dehydrogenase